MSWIKQGGMAMRDLAAVMITVDRSPGANYLAETLRNLGRAGTAASGRLATFVLVDNAPGADFALRTVNRLRQTERPPRVHLESIPVDADSREDRCPNMNVSWSLRVGAQLAPWVLFLEDDLDFCADFFDSVGAWLDDHAHDLRRVYAFGANYPWVEEATAGGCTAANYPIGQFYGTQALALRSEDALSLSSYLVEHCYDRTEDGTAYDLLMADWALETWPEIRHFLASCPSFVQHIGRTSSIRPRPETHTFPSWPGREWSYLERRAA